MSFRRQRQGASRGVMWMEPQLDPSEQPASPWRAYHPCVYIALALAAGTGLGWGISKLGMGWEKVNSNSSVIASPYTVPILRTGHRALGTGHHHVAHLSQPGDIQFTHIAVLERQAERTLLSRQYNYDGITHHLIHSLAPHQTQTVTATAATHNNDTINSNSTHYLLQELLELLEFECYHAQGTTYTMVPWSGNPLLGEDYIFNTATSKVQRQIRSDINQWRLDYVKYTCDAHDVLLVCTKFPQSTTKHNKAQQILYVATFNSTSVNFDDKQKALSHLWPE